MDTSDEDQSIKKVISEKRKGDKIEDGSIPKKKRKSGGKKIKPPTAEEINRLRETENVFHSNLFRLQIEETLKEVRIKETSSNMISSFVEKLKNFLLSIELSISAKLSGNESAHIPNVVPPMKNKPKHADTVFNFMKPKAVNVVGSFNIDCVVKGFKNIDIAVEMPKEMFRKDDYLNEKYLRKRNYYLCCIASKLQDSVEELLINPDIQFSVRHCTDKPSLLIIPTDEKLKKYNIFIHVLPEASTFKETRFSPALNNVRFSWFFNNDAKDGKLNHPTPFYNSLICQDLITLRNEEIKAEVFNNPNFKDALILLKIWLHQRKMDEGLGCFSGYLMSMFIAYLSKNRRLNQHMSAYQVIRNVWVALDQTNWHTDGISLFDFNEEKDKNSLQLFRNAYDVVFIDATGTANLASLLSLNTYLLVKAESKYAVECLDNQAANFYPALFMTPVSFLQYCDHIIYFDKMSVIRKSVERHSAPEVRLDFRHDILIQFVKIISDMLKRTLGNRIFQIFHYIEPGNLNWPISEKKPRTGIVTFGLRINPEFAYNIIDKGPVANLPEAEEFRKFWGEKSELRRFRDGNVCETICWGSSNDSLKKRRAIIQNIVQYVLEKKFQIQSRQYIYIIDQVEKVLVDSLASIFELKGAGEEITLGVTSSFDRLSKQFRDLNNIPLAITSIQGTSPIFRYSEPLPLLANASTTFKKATTSVNNVTVFKDQIPKHMPLYVPPIEATIHFSVTNKWPEDLGAIRRLHAAFYLKLSEVARERFDYVSIPYTTHLDVLKDGYIFRLKISNNYEIAALKRITNEEGITEYRDNEESSNLEKKIIQLPTLNSAIHGLHQQFPVFGTSCTISKRWLRSHLIDDYHFPDICVDLLMAYLLLYPQPYLTTYQPQTMFVRFLNLLSSTNWFIEPIVVNFNNEMSREDIVEIDSFFNSNRSDLPPLFIVTPFDKSGVTWTKEEPSLVILHRIAKLAEAALRSIEASLFMKNNYDIVQQIFRPPLKGYDILIWTKSAINPLRWLAIGADKKSVPPIKTSTDYDKLPIIDFHPIKLFVDELRTHYSEHCIFLYDFYGGNVIGVVLKPDVKQSKDFKVTNMKCCKITNKKIALDIDALIDDFYVIGRGIVSNVEKCNNK